jgi:hypothetical protein
MTDKEKEVITWAFNLAHAVTAGESNLPKPMIYAINRLQDAVYELAKERNEHLAVGCSTEFLEFECKYWDGVRARLSGKAADVQS